MLQWVSVLFILYCIGDIRPVEKTMVLSVHSPSLVPWLLRIRHLLVAPGFGPVGESLHDDSFAAGKCGNRLRHGSVCAESSECQE